MSQDPALLVLALLAALAAALTAAAETAFEEANRVRLRELAESRGPLSAAISRLVEAPERVWTALRALRFLSLIVGGGALWAWLDMTSGGGAWLGALGLALGALLLLDLLPRALAARHPEQAALTLAPPLDLLAFGFYPVLGLIGRLLGYAPEGLARGLRDDELRSLLNVDEENGAGLAEDELEMMAGIVELGDTKVREVMVPRIDIVAIPEDCSLPDALQTIVEAGHSRIPVYRGSIDHIVGLLYAKDLLVHFRAPSDDFRISQVLREPHIVPESTMVNALLGNLRASKVHIAIVVDEYGGTAGLVTIEDLLEEIVGEIEDEYDAEDERFQRVSDDELILSGGVDIDDVNRMMDLDLPTDEVDTVAGLVFTSLGKVPEVGEQARFPEAEIEVLELDGRRIHQVRILRREADEDEAGAEASAAESAGDEQPGVDGLQVDPGSA